MEVKKLERKSRKQILHFGKNLLVVLAVVEFRRKDLDLKAQLMLTVDQYLKSATTDLVTEVDASDSKIG